MTTEKKRTAFISYSRANKEFATKLSKGLRSAGYPVWFDLFDIPTGSRWDDEVEKALRECSIFMIILTPASIASENVKDEIGYAIDHGKRILPILLEDCDVPLRLRRFQYVDFTIKSFEEGFESAKELLRDLVGADSAPVAATTSVVENQMTQKAKYERFAQVKPATERKDMRESDMGRKKLVSPGLVIGIVGAIAVVVLVIAGIGFSALSKLGSSNTSANPTTEMLIVAKPATETLVVAKPATETLVATNTATKAPVVLQGKTIVGQWERHSSNATEHFNIQNDGSYTIEDRIDSTNELHASDKGIITYDQINIYFHDVNNKLRTTSVYHLDNGGDLLVIDNRLDRAWTRVE